MTESPDLYGPLLATARALVMTCVLGPATDVAHGDLASEAGSEARAAAAALDHIGWPGESLGGTVLTGDERSIIRRAALAGLAASAEAVQEAADAGMASDGAWSGGDAITEIDGIVALLDQVGWPEQAAPAQRLRLGAPLAPPVAGGQAASHAGGDDPLEPLHDAFLVVGPDGVIVGACPRFCTMTGFDRAQLVGRGAPYPHWPDENAGWMNDMLTDQLTRARSVEGVTVGRRRDGSHFVMRVISTPILATDGTLVCLMLVVCDDRARRQASRALLESEVRFRELTDALPVPVWFVGIDGTVRQNRAGQDAFGVAEVTPLSVWWALVDVNDRARVQGLIEAAMSEERSFVTECRITTRGLMHRVRVSGQPRRGGDGAFLGYSGTTITLSPPESHLFQDLSAPITWLTTPDGEIGFVSAGAATFSGGAAGAFPAGGFWAMAHPDDREAATAALTRAHQQEHIVEVTMRARRNDGAWRQLAISAEPRFEDGRFAGLVGSMLDLGGVE